VTTAVQSPHSEFASIVGDSRVTSDPAACHAFVVDDKVPSSVVYPQSAEQVAAVLKCAADHSLAVIPCRNRTKIGLGNPPRRYDVALSLKEMNQVWYYEPADLVVSVEPGMKFGDLQHLLGRDRLWLPLEPYGGGRASVGGILATNSSGPLRLGYGTARDMVLGMKIATTEGKVIKTGGRVVKNVTGYDISKLLIGSCGTLGVIVEASFKLYPVPAERATFVLRAGTLDKARELRRMIQRSPLRPLRVVLLDSSFIDFLRQSPDLEEWRGGYQIWIDAGGTRRVLDRSARELESMASKADVPFQAAPWNETTKDVWQRIGDPCRDFTGQGLLLKVSLPIAGTEEYISRAHREIPAPEGTLTCWADSCVGLVHLWLAPASELAPLDQIVPELRRIALDLGGSLVVEWCLPQVKSKIDVWDPPGDDFEVMRKLKEAWDPKGVLSPGRFVSSL
jgi:glycolate oxidase FAD binding subunit